MKGTRDNKAYFNAAELYRKQIDLEKKVQESVHHQLSDDCKSSRKCAEELVRYIRDWRSLKMFIPKMDKKFKTPDGKILFTDDHGLIDVAITKSLKKIVNILDAPMHDRDEKTERYLLTIFDEDEASLLNAFNLIRKKFSERETESPLYKIEPNKNKPRSEHGALSSELFEIILKHYHGKTLENPGPYIKAIQYIYKELKVFDKEVSYGSIESIYYRHLK